MRDLAPQRDERKERQNRQQRSRPPYQETPERNVEEAGIRAGQQLDELEVPRRPEHDRDSMEHQERRDSEGLREHPVPSHPAAQPKVGFEREPEEHEVRLERERTPGEEADHRGRRRRDLAAAGSRRHQKQIG